jgi:hypothetical protein
MEDTSSPHLTRGRTSIQTQILDQDMDQEKRILLPQLIQEMLQVQRTEDLFVQPSTPMSQPIRHLPR